jgi:hypothetical protein
MSKPRRYLRIQNADGAAGLFEKKGLLNYLVRDSPDSKTVVLTRYAASPQFENPPPPVSRQLFWRACALAILCAAVVFSYFELREGHVGSRTAERPTVPLPSAKVAAEPEATNRTKVEARRETAVAPGESGRKITRFILAQSPVYQRLGPVRVKLTAVDAAQRTCDLITITRGHTYRQTKVKVNEAINISSTRRTVAHTARRGPEIVLEEVNPGVVEGYLSEPLPGPRQHRRRGQRHR